MSAAAPQAAMMSGGQPTRDRWPGTGLRLLVVLASLGLGAWLGLRGLATPSPRPLNATDFSAIRASDAARRLLGDQPRPAGSAANAAAVQRLAAFLRARKMDVEVQEATVHAGGRDVPIRNIVARRTGAMPGKAVMVVAHHDSAPASPGAGDDGMGVAVALELSGALATDSWPGRDIIILLTDGEESGLLGARHFAENHRWMADVGTVVNVDNRGNAGPCLLYETGPESAAVLEEAASALAPVVANSLFAEISRHMPYTTDFRVFRERGLRGLNFAVVDGHAHYHQPTDNWSNADLSSLQHQGAVVLPVVYALSMARADRPAIEGDAVFLDVAGSVLAWWPARAGVVASVACLLALPVTAWVGARRSQASKRALVLGVLVTLMRGVVAAGVTWLTLWLLERVGMFGMQAAVEALPEADMPTRARAAFWPASGAMLLTVSMLAGLVTAWFATQPLLRACDGFLLLCGNWTALAAVTTALAVTLPGVTAPLLPALLAATIALAALVLLLDRRDGRAALAVTAVATFLIGLTLAPIQALAWSGVGLGMPALTAVTSALLAAVLLAGAAAPARGA